MAQVDLVLLVAAFFAGVVLVGQVVASPQARARRREQRALRAFGRVDLRGRL